jgi:CRP-like cAMP-binding protein
MNKEVTSSFAVDIEHLHALGVVDPYSPQSIQLYSSGKLVSNERLYFTLWGSAELNTSLFTPRSRIATVGQAVGAAYFIINGSALGLQGDNIYRLGPGSVIGLAEGIGALNYSMTVVAVSTVQVRVIPMYVVSKLVTKMPSGLRGILKSTVMRTLNLEKPPEVLL